MTLSFDDATTRILREADTSPVLSQSVTVVVVAGPDAGKTFDLRDLAQREVLIGKSAACDVSLSDPSVSRRHIALQLEEEGIALRDVGSSNGTLASGLRIRAALLRGGETVTLGATTLRVELGEAFRPVVASTESSFGRVIGASPAMRRLYPELDRLAAVDVPMLIEGEAGTGKALVAEALHERGARKSGPYVVFDRGTEAPAEAEATLFGRDGEGAKPGLLEQANGGTLFIDEITDLEIPLQVKLLRALEKQSTRRVGGGEPIALDVRFIAATRRDPDREVTARRFREELLDFLSSGRVTLPPLRRRRGDITLLVRYFSARYGADPARVPAELLARFEEQPWHGNVRELANAVARHFVEQDGSARDAEPEEARDGRFDFVDEVIREGLAIAQAREKVVAEMERRYLRDILKKHGGNVTRAAAAAGVTRRHFYTLLGK